MLGYQSHLLQRCHPVNAACGHERSSRLSPILALLIFIAIQFQTLSQLLFVNQQ